MVSPGRPWWWALGGAVPGLGLFGQHPSPSDTRITFPFRAIENLHFILIAQKLHDMIRREPLPYYVGRFDVVLRRHSVARPVPRAGNEDGVVGWTIA